MPFRAFRFQYVERQGGAALAGAAYGELGHHDGQAQNRQEKQVYEYEGSASVFAGDKRKPPDIT